MTRKVGYHIIGRLLGCDERKIGSVEEVKKIVNRVIEETKLTALSHAFHQFSPYGVTYIVLLAESHISIHTWPEFRLAHIDIFTCYVNHKENKEKCKKAFELFVREFGASDFEKIEMER